VGERIFFGACNGIFYAVEKTSARVVWKYDITRDGSQRSFHVNPAVDQGIIYVGCDYGQYFRNKNGVGHLYAFDLKTGAVKWKYRVALGVGSDPVLDDRDVFVITLDDELLSLKKDSGRLEWSFQREGAIRHLFPKAAPLVDRERLYVASGDGHFYALVKKTGRVIWQTGLDAGVYTSPTPAADSYYVITRNKTLYRLDKKSGEIKGSFSMPTGPSLAPLLDNGSLLIQSSRAAYALDPARLSLRWTAELGSYMAGRFPVLNKECLIVATQDGRLRCLRRDTGSAVWEYRVDSEITGGIAESDGIVYVGTRAGAVYAIQLK